MAEDKGILESIMGAFKGAAGSSLGSAWDFIKENALGFAKNHMGGIATGLVGLCVGWQLPLIGPVAGLACMVAGYMAYENKGELMAAFSKATGAQTAENKPGSAPTNDHG